MNGMGPIVRHYGISGYGGQGTVASANSPFPGLMMSIDQYQVRPRLLPIGSRARRLAVSLT